MMAGWARVGAKCVCVRFPVPYTMFPGEIRLAIGSIYTVLQVSAHPLNERVGVALCELNHKDFYVVDCFRPLVTSTLEADSAMFLSLVQRMDAIRIAELMLDEFEL